MRLKKCAHCAKDIPSTMQLCPYCRYDEVTHTFDASDSAAGAAQESEIQQDLDQLGSGDPLVQKQIADRLIHKGPSVVPRLISLLNEQSHKGIVEATLLLGRFRDPRALPALLQVLKIGDEELRVSAVWALSQVNDPQVLDELLLECERNNPTVQGYLAHTLTGFQDKRVAPALSKLAVHPSREVAFHAVCALGESGDQSVVRVLRRALGRPDPLIRAAAETSLRRLGAPVRRFIPLWMLGTGLAAGLAAAGGLFVHFYR